MQTLGILRFGVTDSTWDVFKPNWLRKADAGEAMSDKYQQNLFYIMQAETYKYDEGLRRTQPTWTEIAKRAKAQTYMGILFAATLPVSMSAKDPYDYFRQQYKALAAVDRSNAAAAKAAGQPYSSNVDQEFYDKFGDSAFIFAQSMSKNNSGLQPTQNAVKMSKYYQDLVSKVGPEYAGLIVGAEGEGKYSQGAFHYEQTHPTDPASNEPMRSKMSAREALAASNLSRGWQQYSAQMDRIYAELFAAGYQSFDDKGAEQIKAEKQALVQVLSSPQILNEQGVMADNPYYNPEWSEAYNTVNPKRYDEQAAKLQILVNDPEIQKKMINPDGSLGIRSDLFYLKNYLTYRTSAMQALANRKSQGGSNDINAASNADIKQQWNAMVVGMIQESTTFGSLFNRYFSRDMGFDKDTVQQEVQTGQVGQFTGDITNAEQGSSIFDQLEPAQPQEQTALQTLFGGGQ